MLGRKLAVLAAVILLLLGCDARPNSLPSKTPAQTIDFVAVLKEHGYADARHVNADPTYASAMVEGCWIGLLMNGGGPAFSVISVNGPPHSDKVQEELDELGPSPTKSALERTIRELIDLGFLPPC